MRPAGWPPIVMSKKTLGFEAIDENFEVLFGSFTKRFEENESDDA